MSEFPEWVERRIGFCGMSYEDSKELHRKIAAVYELIPDIDVIMERVTPPPRSASFWRRYLWYVVNG